MGVETIAASVGEQRDTIEDVYEPFLLQEGFLQRTPRGRMATHRAYGVFQEGTAARFTSGQPLLIGISPR